MNAICIAFSVVLFSIGICVQMTVGAINDPHSLEED